MATNVTSNVTSPPAPNFRIEYVNPVDPSAAAAIYFLCGVTIFCVLMGIAWREYVSRRHNDRQRTLAYLAPYLPRDGDGGLVIYEDEEVGGKLGKVAEEDEERGQEGVTIANEESEDEGFDGVAPGGEQEDAKLMTKTLSRQKTHQQRL